MNQDQIKVEEAVLSLIDLYVQEDEKDRKYFRKYRKNNPNSGLNKEPFITFYKLFESKVNEIEISDFLYEFGTLRTLKTFHYSNHAESLIKSFNLLRIPIPYFVLECQKEVIHRNDYIKSYLEKEKYKWSKTKKEDFLLEIQKEAKIHSFDSQSEREYLKKKFEEAIQEVRIIESEIQRRLGYFVNGFFDGEEFQVSKEDLNEFFYHSEIACGGCGSFFEVYKALDQYVSKKNEVFTLRGFLSGQIEVRGPESILLKDPKNPTDEEEKNKSIFISPLILDKLFDGLCIYFEGKNKELKDVLNGHEITQKLYFNSNGNKLTDVFYRLHEAGKILNEKNITAQWICDNFENKNQKSGKSSYKYSVVYKQLTDMSGPINKKRRICENL